MPPPPPDVVWRRFRWFMLNAGTGDPVVDGYRDLIASLTALKIDDSTRVERAVAYLDQHDLRDGFDRFSNHLNSQRSRAGA